ncbi:MAG TPA: DUF2007 domain-containing protein [Pyrinomonadaceae bacterium]|nr:DUF2007 domain-containing protein [Pyrinomonadaceae bacterium]
MICPVCEAEYEPGITQCPDDNANLVEKLSSPHDSSEARFVTLHNMGSPAEAEMVNDILHQNGIRSVVKSGGADALSPLLSATWEGAMILVDERDADRARDVYKAFFSADTTPLTGGPSEDEIEDEEE